MSAIKCETCCDGEYYPSYGLAPHWHKGGSFIGSTELLPKEKWPAHFREDPDCPGLGTYVCPDCSVESKPVQEGSET